MSGTNSVEERKPASDTLEETRSGIEQAEAGNSEGLEQVNQTERADPAGAQAIEQEVADGPEGFGRSR